MSGEEGAMTIDKKSLESAFDRRLKALEKAVDMFPWADKQAYAFWLAQQYFLVRHTTTYLAILAGQAGVGQPEGHARALAHLREETGHEALLLEDLKAMKEDIGHFNELLVTSLLYQAQYYWLLRDDPGAHAGYALMLEGLAARKAKQILKAVEEAHGKLACTFLKVHAAEDERHYREGIDALSLQSREILAAVLVNLEQSQHLYFQILETAAQKAAPPVVPKQAA